MQTILSLANPNKHTQTGARVLDDERFPLMLEYEIGELNFHIRYTKISYPTGGELEQHLATEKHVDVYGIYFDFGSDHLRPESTPVLAEIAGVLDKNGGWTLIINGHTDNIGGMRRTWISRDAAVRPSVEHSPRHSTSMPVDFRPRASVRHSQKNRTRRLRGVPRIAASNWCDSKSRMDRHEPSSPVAA